MKDLRRLCLVRFFRVLRRLFAISKPSNGDLSGSISEGARK
jgi:hypothetical protein